MLGAADTTDPRWQNLIDSMQWINEHPLPDDAPPDSVAARALVLAAVVKAENMLQGNNLAAANQAYVDAQRTYQQMAAQAFQNDMPPAWLLGLSGAGINIGGALKQAAIWAGVVLAAYLLLPQLIRGMRGSKSA